MAPETVALLGYPVRLGAAQQQHHDEVVREFQLVAIGEPAVEAHVPGRLLALVDVLTSRYAVELADAQKVRDAAQLAGQPRVDLHHPVSPGLREAVVAWDAMAREVDDYCRAGNLLALAAPPEVVALRAWVTGQFLRQLDGGEPQPWTGPV